MKKVKVNDLRVNMQNDSFTGYIDLDDNTYDIQGTFDVHFESTYPIVTIETLEVMGADTVHNLNMIDKTDLCERIERKDNGTWYENYMNRMSDRMFNDND